ncbi:hypothetical protein Y5S_00584 [Alcanivorax nanhaiticus]|uniref:Uncharacterized protein n=1 Tax=Alcanivorax nanhaiticus TaxID=1177154 RepID=A0A095SNJ0_9GAMM|nr:hypothetical protein Y5S_00584 [Alcanivorax nanhaiticus]
MRFMPGVILDIFIRLSLPTKPCTVPPTIFNNRAMFFDNGDHFIDIVVRGVIGDFESTFRHVQPNTVNTRKSIQLRCDSMRVTFIHPAQT